MEKQRMSSLLKLIAHPERMEILFLLLENDLNLNEIADGTGLSPTAVSNHLAKLRSENVVAFTRYYRLLEYRLVSEETALILRTLKSLQHAA